MQAELNCTPVWTLEDQSAETEGSGGFAGDISQENRTLFRTGLQPGFVMLEEKSAEFYLCRENQNEDELK